MSFMLQKTNFTMPLYAQAVVMVTAKRVNNYSQYSKSIVVLIKNKAQREYYMFTLVSLKVAFFLSCIKNTGWRTKLGKITNSPVCKFYKVCCKLI